MKEKELTPQDKLMKAIYGDKWKTEAEQEKKPTTADVMFNNALDLILELVEDDPSELCELVDTNEPGWCGENCQNFNKTCLCKALKYYNKED